jgi:Family of unknown function (DUF6318)
MLAGWGSGGRRARGPVVAGACACAAVLGLAGCTGGSPAGPTAGTGSTSAGTTAAAAASAGAAAPGVPAGTSPAPTLPAGAEEQTQGGAELFVGYFFDAYDHAFWTADPTLLQSLSDPKCTFCTGAISAVRDLRSQGTRVAGGRITVAAGAVAEDGGSGQTIMAVRLDQESSQTYSKTGALISTSPAHSGRILDIAVRWASGHWLFVGAVAAETPTPTAAAS